MQINGNQASAGVTGAQSPEAPETDLDRDAFMRLLVTQIRNQDPTDPMDTREMMAQLTQLTSVEHLIGIEQAISAQNVATAGMANAQVASFVGHEVEADSTHLRLEDTGRTTGAFELSESAGQATVEIRDENGHLVRTLDLGEQPVGTQSFEWDGNDESGQRLPPGRYQMEVRAASSSGHPVEVKMRIRGTVESVSYESGYPELIIDGHRVLMGDVRRISR